jgi:tetratricopeptide (TPR) repeat protein
MLKKVFFTGLKLYIICKNKSLKLKFKGPAKLFLLLFVASMLMYSCSTKKNTWSRRAFHNLTAHYNGWWNGNESLKEGQRELKKNVEDNYNKVLPVYNYGEEADGQNIAAYTERAIEKGSIVAQRHSMYFKDREFVKWVPESYLLIGKAYFYKHEYQSARMSFEFIINKYFYSDIQYESMLWLAKTYIELENYQKAETYLDLLSSNIGREKMDKEIPNLVQAVYADLYIKQDKASIAIPYLKDAIFDIRNRKLNTRLKYILAQIYQEEGDIENAVRLYNEVLKRNTNYKTTFNAKINLAQLYGRSDEGGEGLVKSLEKMLKDSKNKNFRDQIYYALAEISLADNDKETALGFFKLSVATSVENEYQKAVSALAAAELYYEFKDYKNSGAYYDTTLMFLPETYPNYASVQRQTTIISELVGHLTVVQLEDSLQALAQMPQSDLNAMIDSMIQIIKEEEERAREEEDMRRQTLAMGARNRSNMGPSAGTTPMGGGGWYFYNPQAMSIGFTEFIAKWGSRKLEDNWRLTNKRAIASEPLDELDEEMQNDSIMSTDSAGYVPISTNPKDRNFYLQNIPLSQEAIAASNNKINDALYNAGFIYKESLQRYPEAIETFEDFQTRNPEDNELSIQVQFQLYLLYKENGNLDREEYYKNLIISNYPDSDYAKLLLDPDYFKEMQKKHNYLRDLYEKTYSAYEKEQYTMVVYNADQALEIQREDELIPKFLYLKAISMAKTDIADSMIVNLEKLIDIYPNSEVRPMAENILTNLGVYNPDDNLTEEELAAKEQMEAALGMYTIDKDNEHFFIVFVDGTQINVNALKTRISDHNRKDHAAKGLSVTSLIFANPTQMITVNKFANAERAMVYYRNIINDLYIFPENKKQYTQAMVISADNYPILYQDKDIEKYLRLFELEY